MGGVRLGARHPSLRSVAAAPYPELDILAFDEQAGRAVVVQLTAGVAFDRVLQTPPPAG